MRLGLIARADNTGLGTQTWEFANHMYPDKTLIVDVCHLSPKALSLHPDRFDGHVLITRGLPTDEEFAWLLKDIDVLYTAETAYRAELYTMAKERDVAVVLGLNFEFLDHLQIPDMPQPTLFLAHSTWHYNNIPFTNKAYLPFPVALEHYESQPKSNVDVARHFRHVIGWPAIYDRAGTPQLMEALSLVKTPITMSIACQDAKYVSGLMRHAIPPHVQLRVEAVDAEDYWEVLGEADVLVHPRRFGGLNLIGNEALAAGMPVIMTDISPNNEWLPKEWLVPAHHTLDMIVRAAIGVYEAQPPELAALIDRFATDAQFFAEAQAKARELARQISWKELTPCFAQLLTDSVKMLREPAARATIL